MNECASTSLLAWYDWDRTSTHPCDTAFQVSKPGRKVYVSDDIGADSTLEREISAPILPIGDAFPKILITRTRHEPHTREGVLVLNFARWLLGG